MDGALDNLVTLGKALSDPGVTPQESIKSDFSLQILPGGIFLGGSHILLSPVFASSCFPGPSHTDPSALGAQLE